MGQRLMSEVSWTAATSAAKPPYLLKGCAQHCVLSRLRLPHLHAAAAMSNPFKSKIVSYFYDEEIGNFSYGGGNPMRPHRVRLTHSLVDNYGLLDKLKVNRPTPQDPEQIAMFHADGASPFPVDSLQCIRVFPGIPFTPLCSDPTRLPVYRIRLCGLSCLRDAGQSGGVHDAAASLQPGARRGGRLPCIRRAFPVLPGMHNPARHASPCGHVPCFCVA